AYTVLGYYGSFSPREIYSRAKVATQKTLHLDPALADAHATRAYGMMLYEWDWVAAERGFKKAIEFDPLSVAAHQWYADFLTSMKRHDEAIEQIQLARELDPLSLQINTDVAWVLLHANHYDQAIAQYRQVLEMDEDFGLAHWGLGLAYERSGMFPEAFNSLEKASRITERTPAIVAALGHAYATSGRKSEGPKVLSKLREIATHRYVPAYDMATISFALGDFGQTISWLGRACRERSAYLVNLAVYSRFEKLRRMQSVQDVARQVGLATSQ
ncbi:MAG: tetratricopeptide repeat protein, partial [Blastocatellia bacterium]